MNLFKNLFGKKEIAITSYADFWEWFLLNEKDFFNIVKCGKNIEEDFLDKLFPKLKQIKDGFFLLTGMFNDNTVELVITVDGAIKNIVFAEELVNAASHIEGWKFTALKPELDIENVNIRMGNYDFKSENLHFYPNDNDKYPDEIDITIVYDDFNDSNENQIINGVYVFLDNYLGELHFATTIDNLKVTGNAEAGKELIPIIKLKDYLIWRQKEFIEKYEGTRRDTENDTYSSLEARLENGNSLFAVINTDLLNWESKASHPWIMEIAIKYDGSKSNGMPNEQTYQLLDEIENGLMDELKDANGYLNFGRQTADNVREIYFACKDFRKPPKVVDEIKSKYQHSLEIDYDIYKDKYWRSFDRFQYKP